MIYAIALSPLKQYLNKDLQARVVESEIGARQRPQLDADIVNDRFVNPNATTWLLIVFGGFLTLGVAVRVILPTLLVGFTAPGILDMSRALGGNKDTWGLPTNLQEAELFIHNICGYSFLTISNIYLIVAFRLVNVKVSLIPWAILVNTYSTRSLVYRGADERPFHLLDVMVLAMASYYFGLRHRRVIGDYIIRYWFVILIAFAIIWPPYLQNRMDMNPTHDIVLRTKCQALEFVLVTVWLCVADRIFSKDIFLVDKLTFLNEWALAVFLLHKAAHIVLEPPYSWFFILGLLPIFYLLRRV